MRRAACVHNIVTLRFTCNCRSSIEVLLHTAVECVLHAVYSVNIVIILFKHSIPVVTAYALLLADKLLKELHVIAISLASTSYCSPAYLPNTSNHRTIRKQMSTCQSTEIHVRNDTVLSSPRLHYPMCVYIDNMSTIWKRLVRKAQHGSIAQHFHFATTYCKFYAFD